MRFTYKLFLSLSFHLAQFIGTSSYMPQLCSALALWGYLVIVGVKEIQYFIREFINEFTQVDYDNFAVYNLF